MTKRSLRLYGFIRGAGLLILAAGLLPACGGGHGGAPLAGPCGFLDVTEPNETRDTASPYGLSAPLTGCLDSSADVDMYSFTAPATDVAGGYVKLSFTDVGTAGSLEVNLYSAADNSRITNIYSTTDGGSLYGYLAVAPGVTYRIEVKAVALQAPFRYTLLAAYTALADAYEPNDIRDTAKPIPLGTAVTAFASTGYVGTPYDGVAFSDWYSVSLAAGMVTLKMSNVPTDIRGDIYLFGPDAQQVDEAYSIDEGANVTLTPADAVPAGTYTVQVVPYAGGPVAADKILPTALVPDHFTRPYTLLVTQP